MLWRKKYILVQNFKFFYKCQFHLGILSSENVSCGNHEASSCQDCVSTLTTTTITPTTAITTTTTTITSTITTITSTTTTTTSTEGNGPDWCNGDCIWSNNQCVTAEAGQEGSGSSNLLGIPIINDQLALEYEYEYDDKIDEYDQ